MQPIMTLRELQEMTDVYDSFAVIQECNIPDYYKAIFPKKCRCGAEMIMTKEDRTRLQCCNPCCWVKMAHRLNFFISFHGFKGFGEQACLSLFSTCYDKLEYYSFLSAFALQDSQLAIGLSDYQIGLFNEIREELHDSSFHLVDAIASLGIPNIGPRSPLFDIVKDPIVLLNAMLLKRTDDLCDMCGINASSTRFHLRCFDIDLVLLMRDVMPNIMCTPKGEIFVAITGRVSVNGKEYSRIEFIDLCESIKDRNDNQYYKIIETKAQDKLQYVIADSPSNTSKYRLGEKLGKLITADEFYSHLLSSVEGGEPESSDSNGEKEEQINATE